MLLWKNLPEVIAPLNMDKKMEYLNKMKNWSMTGIIKNVISEKRDLENFSAKPVAFLWKVDLWTCIIFPLLVDCFKMFAGTMKLSKWKPAIDILPNDRYILFTALFTKPPPGILLAGMTPGDCSSRWPHSWLVGVSGIVPGKIMERPGTMRPVDLWIAL